MVSFGFLFSFFVLHFFHSSAFRFKSYLFFSGLSVLFCYSIQVNSPFRYYFMMLPPSLIDSVTISSPFIFLFFFFPFPSIFSSSLFSSFLSLIMGTGI